MRILFAAEPDMETAIRGRIQSSLAGGQVQGEGGAIGRWRLHSSHASDIRADEINHAERLVRS